jgi:hypothetical protein
MTEPTVDDDKAVAPPTETDPPNRLPWQKPVVRRLSLSRTDAAHTTTPDLEGLS